jgi:hypothetical protein
MDEVSSIIPIGAIEHLLGHRESECLEIGTVEYKRKLDAKNVEIKKLMT